MNPLPDALRVTLSGLRVCRANGIPARVLVPVGLEPWLRPIRERGGTAEEIDGLPDRVISFARRFLETGYRAHATLRDAPNEFSCSSYTAYAFAFVGIHLPRYAVDQSYVGRPVSREHPLRKGTLAFWRSEFPVRDTDRSIGHVAIATGDGTLLHASTREGRNDVHVFPPKNGVATLATDPFPQGPQLLAHIPSNRRDLETALDVVRWLQR